MESRFFEGNSYFVDEKVNFLKFANDYKIYDEHAHQIGLVKQHVPLGQKLLRLLLNKGMLPFYLEIQDSESRVLATIRRGWSFWLSRITISDANGGHIARIQQRFRFMKPKFEIIDPNEKLFASILGDWKGWNFSVIDSNENEIGSINKKWAGIAKELFTSADKYNVTLDPAYFKDQKEKAAVLATAVTIDMILKEKN